ncbi:MAG: hypothetical protein EXX96DRAFT_565413 [Benjaminiella poitrasii]|nr:MAG: hypothetical protein EXX96DRAFT_565413 [Benjaminiella poitrasii]
MEHVTYLPTGMIPDAALKMQRTQQKQDASLKPENTAAQRYMEILLDCRLLLLNLSSQVNQMRTNLAFEGINPAFYNTASPSETSYVMLIIEFQSAVAQQVNTAQTFRKATNKPFRHHFGQSPQPSGSFFRTGLSSQQGGFHNNNNNRASGANHFTRKGNTNNPFRKQIQH